MSNLFKRLVFSFSMPLLLQTALLTSQEEISLTAEIALAQMGTKSDNPQHFQPVFPVQISTTVINKSTSATKPQKVLVRYAYPQPHQKSLESIIFETEAVDLPILQPGEEKNIVFTKGHQLPTLADFIHQDWPMRQYQSVTVQEGSEQVVGTLALTYSAYYYPIRAKD